MADSLREVSVNDVRYFRADDVERWHREMVARAAECDELGEQVERLREVLRDTALRIEAAADTIAGALDDEGADIWTGALRSIALVAGREFDAAWELKVNA